ncbi:MAG: hypothetical protein C4524_06035, partial [Candidatus Zixiibacteriota bacterium]
MPQPAGTGNLSSNPLFVNAAGDFHLQPASPCIDAGDPASPLDPDGTRTDMGAFYFDQAGTPAPVEITLTPISPPLVIPAAGGAFQFDAQLLNQSGQTQTFNAWIRWRYPN